MIALILMNLIKVAIVKAGAKSQSSILGDVLRPESKAGVISNTPPSKLSKGTTFSALGLPGCCSWRVEPITYPLDLAARLTMTQAEQLEVVVLQLMQFDIANYI